MTSNYSPENYALENEDDEYLKRGVGDTCSRTFRLFSNEGDEKFIECDSVDEFMNVLEMIRAVVHDDIVFYSEMVVSSP